MKSFDKNFDVAIVGGGPGGYICAIRASQLGKKVAVIEEDTLGGVCLNRGCIPTKAELKAAHMVHELKSPHLKSMGIDVTLKSLNGPMAVKRAMDIANRMAKGVAFLMKKNDITVIPGHGTLTGSHTLEVVIPKGKAATAAGGKEKIEAEHIVIATGAHYQSFPGLQHDGKRLIGAWEAVRLSKFPSSIGIVGAGAIGVEFAYFWNAFGVKVHLFELQPRILPLEDEECSLELEKAYKKYGIAMSLGLQRVTATTATATTKATATARMDEGVVITVTTRDGKKRDYPFDMGLIAVGMTGNIQGLGLESIGVKTHKGMIEVDEFYQTNIPEVYAIGDVSGPPLLAHAASHEGIVAAEHLAGKNPRPLDKMNIPSCTYCQPQVASVGYTEQALKKKGIPYSVGKLPFAANGKAVANNETTGFCKVLLGEEYGELLGAHIVGVHATEMINEYVLFRTIEGIDEEMFATVHPHPTLGEWLGETVMAARGRALNF